MLTQQFTSLALYNQRMNLKIYDLVSTLSNDLREKDLGAFFKSIRGSLEHILVADLIWLRRFQGLEPQMPLYKDLENYPNVSALNQKLYEDFNELKTVRLKLDLWIEKWVQEHNDDFWLQTLNYKSLSGTKNSTLPLWLCVTHFFNHQTHHRGQTTTLLTQNGFDVGLTDLPFVIKP